MSMDKRHWNLTPSRRKRLIADRLSDAPPPPPKDDPGFRPLPGSTPKRLENIVIGKECRWPVGEDPRDMCGLPADPTDLDPHFKPRYCTKHARMSGVRLPEILPGRAVRLPKVDRIAPMTSSVDAEWESA